MSLLDKLGAQKEAKAFYETVDAAVTPQERTLIVRAGEVLAWAVTWRVLLKLGVPIGVLIAVGTIVLGSQATGETPPGVVSEPAIVVPANPGSTSALKVCKDGIVTKGAGQVHIEGTSEMQDGYAAVLGPERLTYTDYPKGGKNLVAILNGQPQTVQPEVVKCLLSRGN